MLGLTSLASCWQENGDRIGVLNSSTVNSSMARFSRKVVAGNLKGHLASIGGYWATSGTHEGMGYRIEHGRKKQLD